MITNSGGMWIAKLLKEDCYNKEAWLKNNLKSQHKHQCKNNITLLNKYNNKGSN